MKVIVAEGDEKIRLVAQHVMEKEGYDFCGVSDGYEAIKRIESEKPDLLIMEVMLPEVNSLDICKAI